MSSFCVSLPANAWNRDLSFDLGHIQTSSCLHQKQLLTEGSEIGCWKESCRASLKPMQKPIVFRVVTPNFHNLREESMKPCNLMTRVCPAQPGKHRVLLAGKGQLVLSLTQGWAVVWNRTHLPCFSYSLLNCQGSWLKSIKYCQEVFSLSLKRCLKSSSLPLWLVWNH